IPVIGSLNGVSVGGWVRYAKELQKAGADAIELNVYYIPTDVLLSSADVEARYLEVLHAVKEAVTVPVAVKLSPYFSSMAHMASRLVNGGADGLVMFNRFYQPDINLDQLDVVPEVNLSDSADARLPMRWIAILHGRIKASLAATTGIHTAEDVLKVVMAGADVAMMCSALLKHGPDHLRQVLTNVREWMMEHEYVSIQQMKGSMSQKSVADPSAFERANYMKALNRYQLLV
ncbi:MAG: dihydroorotate dehydrogenase-like protein, partial [Proteobacteria bacterium]|nr:dihydroorotate dehydrogenase-like protein [Pseudomonadota bacterium]